MIKKVNNNCNLYGMEEVRSQPISLKWALIFSLISLTYVLGTAIARVQLPFIGWFIGVGVMLFCFGMAMKEYKTANQGFLSFGKGFGMAMFIAALGGLIRSVVYYIYLTVDSEFLEYLKETQEEMQSRFGQGGQEAQNEQAQMIVDFLNGTEVMAGMMFLAAIFGGLIFGAIMSAIIKNEEEEY